MPAHGIHGIDWSAASNERAMQSLHILEGHGGIEREIRESGAAAGEQEKYQGAFVASLQKTKDRYCRVPTVPVGSWVAGKKIFQAGDRRFRFCRSRNDAFKRYALRK